MALANLIGWNKERKAASAACGACDQPEEKPAACGAADQPEQKPTACGSACVAGDK